MSEADTIRDPSEYLRSFINNEFLTSGGEHRSWSPDALNAALTALERRAEQAEERLAERTAQNNRLRRRIENDEVRSLRGEIAKRDHRFSELQRSTKPHVEGHCRAELHRVSTERDGLKDALDEITSHAAKGMFQGDYPYEVRQIANAALTKLRGDE